MKKYIFLLFLMFIFVSCGTDYMLSSFYLSNKDLDWFVSPSEQASVDTKYQVTGEIGFRNTSPSILATPDNYILSIYEHRSKQNTDIIGVDGTDTVDVYVSTSLNAENFVTFDKIVGNYSISTTDSHGSPIGFVDKNGNVVVVAVGGFGFGQGSDPDKLTPISVSISSNNGKSWTDWEDIDTNVFKSLADEGYNRYYTNPGNGKRLKNGTLACIIDFRDSKAGNKNTPIGFAVLYSINDGKDWQIGATTKYTGNHRFARIIAENSDGSLLIAAVPKTDNNYNTQGNLQFFKLPSINGTISTLDNVTGLPQNNGGSISGDNYTFVYNGLKKNGIILAHSYPNRKYTNQNGYTYDITNCTAISISEDNGYSWKLITNIVGTGPQDKASFRQSLMVLKDGTITTCYEEGNSAGINSSLKFYIVYRRFSLEKISYGQYKYEGL